MIKEIIFGALIFYIPYLIVVGIGRYRIKRNTPYISEADLAKYVKEVPSNLFGNTNRYTDEYGKQNYTSNTVIDWSTYDPETGTVCGTFETDDNT